MIELKNLPDNMKDLPKDKRGYPVPWFVHWENGLPVFPMVDPDKWVRAIKDHICWVCGKRLGAFKVFVLGPICGVTRSSFEPAVHRDCGLFSVQNCPFLVNPNAKRILEDQAPIAGISIDRNPGIMLLWTSKSFGIFKDVEGKFLIRLHDPIGLEAWASGVRVYNSQLVLDSVLSAMPELEKKIDPQGLMELHSAFLVFEKLCREKIK